MTLVRVCSHWLEKKFLGEYGKTQSHKGNCRCSRHCLGESSDIRSRLRSNLDGEDEQSLVNELPRVPGWPRRVSVCASSARGLRARGGQPFCNWDVTAPCCFSSGATIPNGTEGPDRSGRCACAGVQAKRRRQRADVQLFGASGEDRKAGLTWADGRPIKVWRSNLSELPLKRIDTQVDVRAWDLITLRIET